MARWLSDKLGQRSASKAAATDTAPEAGPYGSATETTATTYRRSPKATADCTRRLRSGGSDAPDFALSGTKSRFGGAFLCRTAAVI